VRGAAAATPPLPADAAGGAARSTHLPWGKWACWVCVQVCVFLLCKNKSIIKSLHIAAIPHITRITSNHIIATATAATAAPPTATTALHAPFGTAAAAADEAEGGAKGQDGTTRCTMPFSQSP
jgi:hypothetical protein